MSTTVLALAAAEVHQELPLPTYAYGVIALVTFAFLLAVTFAFRGTANKVPAPVDAGSAIERHGAPDSHGTPGTPGTHGGAH